MAVFFSDQFEHTIDDKGRLVLPSAYRAAFADGGYLAYLGAYAAIFTTDGWDKYRRKLELSEVFDRDELQLLYSFVSPVQPDTQYRVPVGKQLRDQAGLSKHVAIVGSGSHAAIYDRDVWKRKQSQLLEPDASGATMTQKFGSLGFL